MNEQSLILTEILAREAAKDKNGIVDMFSYIGLCALDIICGNKWNESNSIKQFQSLMKFFLFNQETAMGKNLNAQNDHESQYVKTIARWAI